MKNKSTLKHIKLEDLELDLNNPRFAELYSGSQNEDDLIEYLLYSEAADDVAKAIVSAEEFYPDRPLWVIKNNGKFLVKDGNRRCSAVKALQMPGKFKLNLPKTSLNELPALVYDNAQDIDIRIVQEHAGNLFRRWERIAKALEVYKLFNLGTSVDSMKELDSQPADLIKLASFYFQAVKIGHDDLKQLLRRGRGKNSGRTIIFERLFKQAEDCGYRFKRKPQYIIEVFDKLKFEAYIKAVVNCLLDDVKGEITTDTIDKKLAFFFEELKDYGFDRKKNYNVTPATNNTASNTNNSNNTSSNTNNTSTADSNASGGTSAANTLSPNSQSNSSQSSSVPNAGNTANTSNNSGRGSIKKTPLIKRKQFPPGLKSRIDEYFQIDSSTFPNAKVAMARVTYECVLKYVIENTKSGNIVFKNSGHFGSAYSRKPYTNFEELNKKFIELINEIGIAQAFRNFEFEKMHQIIHNYHVASRTIDADQIKNNLLILIEFMLQDEADLLTSLDISKIR